MTDTPAEMEAIAIDGAGGPDVLRPVRRPVPTAAPGEVLIRVAAAGVNRPDVFQRKGAYPPPPGASDLPGLEVAGVVVALGEGVTEQRVGDRVCALLTGGGYAGYATAPGGQCLPWPQGLSAAEAASLPETAFTVWTNVFERGRFQPGDTVLIHGGTSGIGVMAIQLVTALGGRALATAGSDDKARACERLGAVRGVNYRTEDFVEAALAATEGRGVDLVLDMVGGDYLPRNVAACATDARIVVIATLGGAQAGLDLSVMMRKRLTLTGSTLRARGVEQKRAIRDALRERVWPLVEAGRLHPVIDSVFPLAQAADAHRRMESSAHVGKIVLEVETAR